MSPRLDNPRSAYLSLCALWADFSHAYCASTVYDSEAHYHARMPNTTVRGIATAHAKQSLSCYTFPLCLIGQFAAQRLTLHVKNPSIHDPELELAVSTGHAEQSLNCQCACSTACCVMSVGQVPGWVSHVMLSVEITCRHIALAAEAGKS